MRINPIPLLRPWARRVRARWSRFVPEAGRGPVRLANREFGFIGKLDRLRVRAQILSAAEGLALATGVVLVSLLFRCLVDFWLVMPWLLRLGFLLAELLFAAAVLYRFVIRPLRHPPTDTDLALRVERARPILRGRLISTLQLNQPDAARGEASPALVRALTEQTEKSVRNLPFSPAFPAGRPLRLAARAAGIVVIAVAAFVLAGDAAPGLVRRAFLSLEQVPRKTLIYSETGNINIGRGDSVDLLARTEGVIPRTGEVEIRYDSGRDQRLELRPDEDQPRFFSRTIKAVSDSFSYRFHIGDGTSRTHTVTVRDRPAIAETSVRVHPPPYLGGPARPAPLTDIRALPGGRIEITATGDRPVDSGTVTPHRSPGPAAMDPVAGADDTVRGSFSVPTEGLRGLSLRVTDRNGVSSNPTPVYPVRVTPDEAPEIRVLYPVEINQTATPGANLLLSFRARDDHAVSRIQLVYRVNRGEESVIEMDLEAPAPEVHRRFDWNLNAFPRPLERGDLIEFRFEASDQNDITGPGEGKTRNYLVRIVDQEEKRAELLGRVLDNFSDLSRVATDQFELNQKLGEIINERQP
ncbi:MAG: hypothetical protein ACLFTU_07925 [Puniceicoccaceae bacterium]